MEPVADIPEGRRRRACNKVRKDIVFTAGATILAVFVLDKHKHPLMPCTEKRARLLLERGRARVHCFIPFTIRLTYRLAEESVLQPIRLKLDPGSKTTGIALVREQDTEATTQESIRTLIVLKLIELQRRGQTIRDALTQRRAFRRRRRGNLRYRPARFDNRTKPEGWLAPSLQHRVDTVTSWVKRIRRLAPVTALSQELVRFDTQIMQNPEISGVEYQQGALQGYEIREYLLEKWNRKCAYCGAGDTPLEMEHIHPRSRGGSDRVSNFTLACHACNQKKGNMPLEEFLSKHPERARSILAYAKTSLRDAAAINSTRWALFQKLKATGLDMEAASGGRTKWNRHRLNIPKAHCLDAVCVGDVDAVENWRQPALTVKSMGRGSYQRTRLTKYGFPRGYLTRCKSAFGFQTGDMVLAVVNTGKKAGTYWGRVAIRASGSFNIQSVTGLVQGIHHRFCKLLQRADGYGYSLTKTAIQERRAGMGAA
jgi:5-methylcytosine-specific restriction endonuclease McrA